MVTSGFDISAIYTAIGTRLGFKNPTLSGYGIVDTTNQTATSGRYFGDFHPAVTIQNIKDTQEDLAISDANFNTLLSDWNKSSLAECLSAVFAGDAPIENGLLFENDVVNLIPQRRSTANDFVFITIKVAQGDYAVSIDTAQMLFDADIASLTLYLFQEHKSAAIATVVVTGITANELKIVDVAAQLNDVSITNKGGRYYFGYFQSDIGSAKALEYAQCWRTFKVFSAMTGMAAKTGTGTFNRFAINTSYANYGLNLELSSYKDHTRKIVTQAGQFDTIRGLIMAYKVISQVLNTNRSNVTERIGRENAMAWNNDANAVPVEGLPYTPSLKWRITQEVKRLQKVFVQRSKNQIVTYGECD